MSLEEELKEGAEHAHQSGEKGIGLTMAIVAVLLAIATLMGHRAHTEEGLIQGKIVDEWNFYQAKHSRAHEYGAIAEVAALLPNGKDLALKDYKKSLDEECGTPAEHGCSSPARDSALLRPLLTPAESATDSKDENEPMRQPLSKKLLQRTMPLKSMAKKPMPPKNSKRTKLPAISPAQ